MSILAITGATGKKSGGAFVDVLCEHKNEVLQKFGGGYELLFDLLPTQRT